MLTAIVRFALRFRGIVIALACLLIGYGVFNLSSARYDVFPEFAPPQVSVNTEAPGLSPEQVEVMVTQPIENSLEGVPGVVSIRSESIQGISVITIVFDPGRDVYQSRQLVAERLGGIAKDLPQGVLSPGLTPLLSSTGDLLVAGLTSQKKSLMELRTIADWLVRPHLLAVPGVANVAIYGGDVRQLQVQLRPEKLVRYQLSVDDVFAVVQKATGVEGAGFIDTPNQRIVLQPEGQLADPSVLAGTIIRSREGFALTLGDIAEVKEAAAPAISGAHVMGKTGILMKVSVHYGANTLEVSRRVEAEIASLQRALQGQDVELRSDLFRAANFIDAATHNVRGSLLLGAALVVIVLFLFLANFRTAAISCTAIPLSLMTAAALLEKFGYSMNTMTMGGLAIAIGEVVDDAVIDVENILRRLAQNRKRAIPHSAFRVVLDASIEVRSAVVYATFAVVLVFLPVLTLSGLAGRMFAPLGIAYITAILASLVVALTVTPAMCLVWLRLDQVREDPSPLSRWLHRHYRRFLGQVEKKIGLMATLSVVLSLAAFALYPFLTLNFLPVLRENHFLMHMTMSPGTSIESSMKLGQTVSAALLKLTGVRTVSGQVGRAALDDVRGAEATEFDIDLKDGADINAAGDQIRKTLAGIPGATYEVNSFLTERVNETLTGFTAPVVINVFGNDLDQLQSVAERINGILAKVPGASEAKFAAPPGNPQLSVKVRPKDLTRLGFSSVEVMDTLRMAYEGANAGQIHVGNLSYNVTLILHPDVRNRLDSVARLPIRNRFGRYAMLSDLADIYESTGRYVVQHEASRRVLTITSDVKGRPVRDFVAEAQRRVEQEGKLPPGVYIRFGGMAEEQATAQRDLIVHSLMAGAGIVCLLIVVLGHRNNLFLVLLNLPFALAGGVIAAFFFDRQLSLGSLVGFVTVFGITLRNSIMLLSHYEHLVVVEESRWDLETAVRGASERLVPILMTALVTALGLLPLALGRNLPGREIEGPMALVILGGLFTSTLLNLMVLPSLALRFGRFAPRPREEDDAVPSALLSRS